MNNNSQNDRLKMLNERRETQEALAIDRMIRFKKRMIAIGIALALINTAASFFFGVSGFWNLAIVFAVTSILSWLIARYHFGQLTSTFLFGAVFFPLSLFVVGGSFYAWFIWPSYGAIVGIAFSQERSVIA